MFLVNHDIFMFFLFVIRVQFYTLAKKYCDILFLRRFYPIPKEICQHIYIPTRPSVDLKLHCHIGSETKSPDQILAKPL
jgi:hypothetical protein